MQWHVSLQRVRAGLDERSDVLADESALADTDQLLGRFALPRVQLVLLRNGVEVLDHAIAQLRAVPHFEQEAIEPVRFRRRMLVELITLIAELEAAVLLHCLSGRHRFRATGKESNHAEL